jgi:hypothetical protein
MHLANYGTVSNPASFPQDVLFPWILIRKVDSKNTYFFLSGNSSIFSQKKQENKINIKYSLTRTWEVLRE